MLLAASPGHAAEHYRWDVKTGADALARLVSRRVEITVDELNRLPRPPRGATAEGRVPPVEQTEYVVTGRLLVYRLEQDGDIHLVIQDETSEATLIAEIPNPDLVSDASPWRSLIQAARATFEREFRVTASRSDGGRRMITLRGVGFWDRRDHGIGASENGVELHPVLSLSLR